MWNMLVLGLNAYHGDSSACIVRDGELVAAAEEERFTRIKHWAGFPSRAISSCLQIAGARLADVNIVAVNRDPRANALKKLVYVLRHRPDLKLILDRLRNARTVTSIEAELAEHSPRSRSAAMFGTSSTTSPIWHLRSSFRPLTRR